MDPATPRIRWPLVATMATVGAVVGWRVFWKADAALAWILFGEPVLYAWYACMGVCIAAYMAQGFMIDRARKQAIRAAVLEALD